MSRLLIEERLKLLEVAAAQHLAQYHACNGAVQELRLLAQTMVAEEAAATKAAEEEATQEAAD